MKYLARQQLILLYSISPSLAFPETDNNVAYLAQLPIRFLWTWILPRYLWTLSKHFLSGKPSNLGKLFHALDSLFGCLNYLLSGEQQLHFLIQTYLEKANPRLKGGSWKRQAITSFFPHAFCLDSDDAFHFVDFDFSIPDRSLESFRVQASWMRNFEYLGKRS